MLVRVVQLAVESTAGVYVCGGVGSSVWARFFADDPVTRASLQGARLRRSGRLYSFVHKSIPEYFAACAMWADVVAVCTAMKTLAMPTPSGATLSPVAVSGEELQAVSTVLETSSSPGGDCTSALNRIHVSAQPAVLAFMVDMLMRLPLEASSSGSDSDGGSVVRGSLKDGETTITYHTAVAALHAVVRSSAIRKDIGTASANCGSVLARSSVSLSGAQWDGTCLKGAVLSEAVLSSASLRGADLRGCRLERIVADAADLSDANLEGASFGQYPMMLGHTAAVTGLILSPDGKTLVSCADPGRGVDSTVRLWDVATSACVGILDASVPVRPGFCRPEFGVIAVAFYPDGSALVSSHKDNTLRIWDLATQTCVGTVPLGKEYAINALSVAVSPNGRMIAVGLEHRHLRVYNASGSELAMEIPSR